MINIANSVYHLEPLSFSLRDELIWLNESGLKNQIQSFLTIAKWNFGTESYNFVTVPQAFLKSHLLNSELPTQSAIFSDLCWQKPPSLSFVSSLNLTQGHVGEMSDSKDPKMRNSGLSSSRAIASLFCPPVLWKPEDLASVRFTTDSAQLSTDKETVIPPISIDHSRPSQRLGQKTWKHFERKRF